MAEQKRHMDVPKERFLGGASRQRAPASPAGHEQGRRLKTKRLGPKYKPQPKPSPINHQACEEEFR
ncbi:hypothetical protein MARI_03730 [Marinobacter sp. JH2]|nr:hypothetical protein MARI_03730 [Marinobacter sp. JH2]